MIDTILPNFKPPPVEGSEGKERPRRAGKKAGPSFTDILNDKKKGSGAVEDEIAGAAAQAQSSIQTPVKVNPPDHPAEEGSGDPDDAGSDDDKGTPPCVSPAAGATLPTPAEQLMMAGTGTTPVAAQALNTNDAGAAACAPTGQPVDGVTAQAVPADPLAGQMAAQPDTVVQAKETDVAQEKFASLLSIAEPDGGPVAGTKEEKANQAPAQSVDTDANAGVSAADIHVEQKPVPESARQPSSQAATSSAAEKAEVEVAGEKRSADQQTIQQPQVVINGKLQDVPGTTTQEPARTAEASGDILSQIAKNVQLVANQQQTSLRVHLNPHELGSIDIRLISNQNGVGIVVLAEKATTGRMLESQMSQLQQTLRDAGVQVTQMFIGQNGQQDAAAQAQANLMSHQGQEQSGARNQHFVEMKKQAEQLPQSKGETRYSLIDFRA